MRFVLSDSFFLFNSFSRSSNAKSTHDRFLFSAIFLGMMAILVANFPEKSVRLPSILGFLSPIIITFFPWRILQENIVLGFVGIFICTFFIVAFLSGFQEQRNETPSKKEKSNIILTMYFVLYSFVSSGMIFIGLIDATKYDCCHKMIYNYIDNICMFLFGIVFLSIIGITMRCGSRYEMNITR